MNTNIVPPTKLLAVRILDLGLTAYGNTEEEALVRLVKILAADVAAHLEVLTPEECGQWIKRSGLTSTWTLGEDGEWHSTHL